MNHPTVLVLAPLPDSVVVDGEVYRVIDGGSAEKLDEALNLASHEIRAVIANGVSVVPSWLIERLPRLEIIVICGVGYDGVDLVACRARGIRVTNTPDVLTEDVADIALALVLMTSRRLVAASQFLQQGGWVSGAFPLSSALGGKKAGIVGLGRIGQAIARRLQPLGMTVAYHGRRQQPVEWLFMDSLMKLAEWADFLVLACPGGEQTRHLVDETVLRALGKTGILINVARGSVVDEAALIRCLEAGATGGAGLDVFEHEPSVPEALKKHENVVLLPHVGSATHETRQAMGELTLRNLGCHFAGQPLLTPVL